MITDPTSLTYTPTSQTFTTPATKSGDDNWALAGNLSSALRVLVPDGQALYLRWTVTEVLTLGKINDEFAIDNIGVAATKAVPEPVSTLLPGLAAVAGAVSYWRRRRTPAPDAL